MRTGARETVILLKIESEARKVVGKHEYCSGYCGMCPLVDLLKEIDILRGESISDV